MKALIIEDEPSSALVLKSWLEGIGFDVTITESMELAAHIIMETHADIITLDLNLKDSKVSETIPKIAEIRQKSPDSLLVVVSGVMCSTDPAKCAALGADACFEKLDIPTEKSFLAKLWDVVTALIRNPKGYARNIPLIEAIEEKLAQRCKEIKSDQNGPSTKVDE